MSIEAMKLALEALTTFREWEMGQDYNSNRYSVLERAFKAEETLSQAIEQAQKRPQNCGTGYCSCIECVMEPVARKKHEPTIDLDKYAGTYGGYTSPPQRKPLTGWQPIETAPKDGTDVLVMYIHIDTQVVHNGFWMGAEDTDEESDIGWWSYEHSEVSRIKLDDWMTPTHWMPLPSIKGEA